MARKRKRGRPSRRRRFKRQQRLQSAECWLETYTGNKVVKDYRKRYGVDWQTAFIELEMLGVSIDPEYKDQVLRTVDNQLNAKRRKKADQRAAGDRLAGVESDDYFAFIVGYTSGGAPYGLSREEWEALEAAEIEEE